MTRLRVTHRTAYSYDSQVTGSYSEARLLPRTLERQTCISADLVIDPLPADTHEHRDYFGNRVRYFAVDAPHSSLVVTAVSEVEVHETPRRLDLSGGQPWEAVREQLRTGTDPAVVSARQFVLDSPMVSSPPEIRAYAETSFWPGRPVTEAVLDLTRRIHDDFEYRPGTTTIATRLAEVLDRRRGVCQDFAHLAIGCIRSMGLPARYVSGYLETEPPPGHEKLLGVDASHAWFSVFLPGSAWLDVDPTNDQVPDECYVTTAWGRDYADVAPLKGVVFSRGGQHELQVAVDVIRAIA